MGTMGSDYKTTKTGEIVSRFPTTPAPVSPAVRAAYLLDRQAARETPEWREHVRRTRTKVQNKIARRKGLTKSAKGGRLAYGQE